MSLEDKTIELAKELKEASDKYYNEGTSLLTDEEFDSKRKQLKELDPDNPVLKTIGAPVHGETVRHNSVMLSLDDFWKYEDLPEIIKEADKKFPRDLIPELKYDGIAASVVYLNGKLLYVATRGDGQVGEVITEASKHVDGIPIILSKDLEGILEIRGEIVLPKSKFNILKESLGYMTARNTVAGLLRRKDHSFVEGRGLIFIPYEVPRHPFKELKRYSDVLKEVLGHGPGSVSDKEIKESFNWYSNIQDRYSCFNLTFDELTSLILEKRDELPFDIDGLVFKHDTLSKRKELGITGRVPRWSIAFKFPGSIGVTALESVDWQVSRNGRLTPVGKVSPIQIGGVVYTSVTLHNCDEISRLGVKLNDKILIERRGDVIPKIMKVVESLPNSETILTPMLCPSCDSLIKLSNTDPSCDNSLNCHDQIYQKIVHFASRKAMNIEGLADSTSSALVKSGLVKTVCDLYTLTINDLMTLPGFAEQSAMKLYNAIQESKTKPLSKLIFGLGARGIGEATANVFSGLIGNLNNWLEIETELFSNIPLSLIDHVARTSLIEYASSASTRSIIRGLLENGINPVYESIKSSDKLENKNYVITGSFPGYSREDISKLVISNGGKQQSSISKNTDFLIAGDKAGTKLMIANKLNVPVITLEEFMERIS